MHLDAYLTRFQKRLKDGGINLQRLVSFLKALKDYCCAWSRRAAVEKKDQDVLGAMDLSLALGAKNDAMNLLVLQK